MKLKYIFEMVDMGEEIICVPVGERAAQVHGVLKMNPEGREIMELLKEETNEGKIVDALATKYDNDRIVLENYVRDVLDNLRNAKLIED